MATELKPMLDECGYTYTSLPYVASVIELLKHRIHFLKDLVEFADYMFSDTLTDVDKGAWDSLVADESLRVALSAIQMGLNSEALETSEAFKALVNASAEKAGMKMGKVMKPLRLVITHREVGAELYDTIRLLGVDRTQERLALYLS